VNDAFRAPTLDDMPALVEFFDGLRSEYDAQVFTESDLRADLARSGDNVADNYRILLDGERVRGWAVVWSPMSLEDRVFLGLRALPRERETYRRLADWVEGRVRERGAGRVVRARAQSESDDEPLREELHERGFTLARHFFEMEIDLADEPPPPSWPDGFAPRTFTPDDAHAVYEADLEAFEDHWEPLHVSFDEWYDYFTERQSFDPELWFLVEDGDELAGFSLCARRTEDEGRVHVLGVRRPWRRLGLGSALLLHSLRELRARGCKTGGLSVDGENTTGAVALYEQAGMHVARRTEHYLKDIV
jgi:mycothiol synthase